MNASAVPARASPEAEPPGRGPALGAAHPDALRAGQNSRPRARAGTARAGARRAARGRGDARDDGTADWLCRLEDAAWVVEPDGTLGPLNRAAERLLGESAATCLGRPCHAVVRGRDPGGRLLCSRTCAALAAAQHQGPVRSLLMRRDPGRGTATFLLVTFLPLAPARGQARLVHVAHPMDSALRARAYLEDVLATAGASRSRTPPSRALSPRELEVLDHLCHGQDLKQIARRLAVSYATVRNHVQHVLRRLGVHSTQEAVALRLLEDELPAGE